MPGPVTAQYPRFVEDSSTDGIRRRDVLTARTTFRQTYCAAWMWDQTDPRLAAAGSRVLELYVDGRRRVESYRRLREDR